jgi:type II secretory pathway pseudopilin PulG
MRIFTKYLKARIPGFFQNRNFITGVSFIESLIVVAAFTIILLAVVSSLQSFYRVNSFNIEQAFAVSSARKGVEVMVRDIREAIYADDGAYPISNIGSTTITFFSDVDGDDNTERVRFFLEGNLFKKATLEPSGDPPQYVGTENISTISDNVRNDEEGTPIFQYFDDTGAEITDFSNVFDVAFIKVSLIVNINPTRLPNEFTIRSSATLRNLKINL